MIRVEFYGIPRSRAGIDAVDVPAGQLGVILQSLSERLPAFANECLHGNSLRSGYLACVNGTHFTTDGDFELHDGDALIILSADVGG